MTHDADPGLWQTVGIAIAGILAGIGGAFGLKKKPAGEGYDAIHEEIGSLQYKVHDMRAEIAHIKENMDKDASALQRMEARHNDVVIEIFKKLEAIGLNVNTMQTEIRLVIGGPK